MPPMSPVIINLRTRGRHRSRSYRFLWLAISACLVVVSGALAQQAPSGAAQLRSTYTIWPSTAAPASFSKTDTATTLGTRFSSKRDGVVTAIRFYKGTGDTGPHIGTLWGPDGSVLARATFSGESTSGWQEARLDSATKISAGRIYTASYRAHRGKFSRGGLAALPKQTGDLTALGAVASSSNGRPSSSSSANHFVDVRFAPQRAPRAWKPPRATTTAPPTTSTTSTAPTSTTSTATTTTSSSTTATSPPSTTSSSTANSPSVPPTSATSSTTSTAGATQTGCATKPSACGYPDATNTGVTPGTTLRASGCVNASTDGQVVENLSISGCTINVTAKNVTIRNVRMSLASIDMFAVIVRSGASATIQNVEISGLDKTGKSLQYAILSQTDNRVTVDRANLHHCADCIQGEAMVVTNSYIHDLANPPGAHVDGFQCNSSCGVTLTGNTILNEWDQTATIALFADFGTPRNSVIRGNLLAGGGYTVYAGGSNATGIEVTGNRFSRLYSSRGGNWGHGTQFVANTGNVWSGNFWDDTGLSVPRP